MLVIQTAWRADFGKVYSSVSATDLEELRQLLLREGNLFVHLISADAMEDTWMWHKSRIAVRDLSQEDIEWVTTRSDSLWSSRRYLVCKPQGACPAGSG